MALLVLDASVVVALYIDEHSSENAHKALKMASVAQSEFYAPELLLIEVANALDRGVLDKRLSRQDAVSALDDLMRLEALKLHSMRSLSAHALALALRHKLTAYDASYAALAVGLNGILLSQDQQLLTEAPKIGITAMGPSELTADALT